MSELHDFVKRFLRDDRGVTAIEYGLLGSLIVVAIVAAVTNWSNAVSGMYQYVTAKVVAAIS